MATKAFTVEVDPSTELAQALNDAVDSPVVLISNGVRYLVTPEEAPWANYSPAKLRASLRRIAGTISPEEAERWKADVYQARLEGSRPPDRSGEVLGGPAGLIDSLTGASMAAETSKRAIEHDGASGRTASEVGTPFRT